MENFQIIFRVFSNGISTSSLHSSRTNEWIEQMICSFSVVQMMGRTNDGRTNDGGTNDCRTNDSAPFLL